MREKHIHLIFGKKIVDLFVDQVRVLQQKHRFYVDEVFGLISDLLLSFYRKKNEYKKKRRRKEIFAYPLSDPSLEFGP
jgi:hypothetical protein